MYYSSAAQSVVTSYYIGWFIGSIIWGIIWGCATNAIIHNKGYDENWFWWGFFFSIIAVIVAATKPENRSRYDSSSDSGTSYLGYNYSNHNSYPTSSSTYYGVNRTAGPNEWKCNKCGRINPNYTGTCACGTSKYDLEEEQRKIKEAQEEAKRIAEEEKAAKEAEKIAAKMAKESKSAEEIKEHQEIANANAIKEYKKLLDEGIISPEEFDAKKKQLLGL